MNLWTSHKGFKHRTQVESKRPRTSYLRHWNWGLFAISVVDATAAMAVLCDNLARNQDLCSRTVEREEAENCFDRLFL